MRNLVEFLFWHTAESTVFAIVAVALVSAFRLHKASNRFLLLQFVLLKFFIPLGAIASIVFPIENIAPLALKDYQLHRISNLVSSFEKSAATDWFAVVLVIWILGILALGTPRAIGLYRNGKLAASSEKPSSPTGKRVEQAIRQAGYRNASPLPIIETLRIPSIGLTGFFSPRILINTAFLETLTENELLAAIKHELAHLYRRDNLWRLSQEIALSLFWFHPLVWMLRQKLRSESEIACDEFALSQGEEPESYAKCLLKAASTHRQYKSVWVTCFSATTLKKRVRNIVTFDNRKEAKMKLLALYLVVICSLGATLIPQQKLMAADYEENLYSIQDLDKKPAAIEFATPVYPKELHDSKIPGKAVVEFILDNNGEVHNAHVIKSTHPGFEQPSIDSVTNSTWAPGEISGQPVNVLVRIPIVYTP